MSYEISLGGLTLNTAEFVVYNNYTADGLCEMGASSVSVMAKDEFGQLYLIYGTIVCCTDYEVTLKLESIIDVFEDDDGDLEEETFTSLSGIYITVPPLVIKSILTITAE